MVGTEDWQERIGIVLRSAHDAESPEGKALAFLRAARIARRYAPEEVEGILGQAYVADSSSSVAAATVRGAAWWTPTAPTTSSRANARCSIRISDPKARADLAFRFGVRWALRHQNVDQGMPLVEEALKLDPGHEAAFAFLKDVYGTREGNWERVLDLAERCRRASRGARPPRRTYWPKLGS